jgi:hypothetical protein
MSPMELRDLRFRLRECGFNRIGYIPPKSMRTFVEKCRSRYSPAGRERLFYGEVRFILQQIGRIWFLRIVVE